ncbi:MAG: inositol monophosphatase [Planctomycetales bacterium]|nr:inositol monophosphatase [Planctomycetales bacterium]
MPTHQRLLEVCLQAARAGGAQLEQWRGKFATREKRARDLVTDADLASQQAVHEAIRQSFPDHELVAEESQQGPTLRQLLDDPNCSPHCWVVDPLDGTTNYVHGFPCYCVSVAVLEHGEIVAGVVFSPVTNECFAALRGGGATLNGEPISVSQAKQVDESLVAVSFPPGLRDDSPDLLSFLQVAGKCQAVRRTGSAAMNLAYVASGRLDAHWAHEINPWDAAAGVLLVREAGGVVTCSNGGPYDLAAARYFASCGEQLHAELGPLVAVPRPS